MPAAGERGPGWAACSKTRANACCPHAPAWLRSRHGGGHASRHSVPAQRLQAQAGLAHAGLHASILRVPLRSRSCPRPRSSPLPPTRAGQKPEAKKVEVPAKAAPAAAAAKASAQDTKGNKGKGKH